MTFGEKAMSRSELEGLLFVLVIIFLVGFGPLTIHLYLKSRKKVRAIRRPEFADKDRERISQEFREMEFFTQGKTCPVCGQERSFFVKGVCVKCRHSRSKNKSSG